MNRRAAAAKERDALLMRSALCRLRLHRDTAGLRNSISWRHALLPANTSVAGRRIGFGLALSLVGVERGARLIALAGRLVLLAGAAQAAIGFLRRSWHTRSSA